MIIKNIAETRKKINKLLNTRLSLPECNLKNVVEETLAKKDKIKALASKHPTPFYIFDDSAVDISIHSFLAAFTRSVPRLKVYYAIKSNPRPLLLKKVLDAGCGLDVSSARELSIGLQQGASDMLLSGPGKSIAELELAVKNYKKIIINLDSFGELEKLGTIAKRKKINVRAGDTMQLFYRAWPYTLQPGYDYGSESGRRKK